MDKAKEFWIKHYIFFHGKQWSDPRPTREEAERAWADAHPVHTTEPPEWKGVGDGYEVQSFPDGSNRVRYVGQTKPFATTPPQPSPLDRALEDFIERRRAKREGESRNSLDGGVGRRPEPFETASGVRVSAQGEASPMREAPFLSRALSTPLPHDPDIHTRVMPWKGKADE